MSGTPLETLLSTIAGDTAKSSKQRVLVRLHPDVVVDVDQLELGDLNRTDAVNHLCRIALPLVQEALTRKAAEVPE